jgi:hypothetical protein
LLLQYLIDESQRPAADAGKPAKAAKAVRGARRKG